MLSAQHHALFQAVRPSSSKREHLSPLVALDFGQETKMARLIPRIGQAQRRAQAPCSQHRAVPAQGNQQIELSVQDPLVQISVL